LLISSAVELEVTLLVGRAVGYRSVTII